MLRNASPTAKQVHHSRYIEAFIFINCVVYVPTKIALVETKLAYDMNVFNFHSFVNETNIVVLHQGLGNLILAKSVIMD